MMLRGMISDALCDGEAEDRSHLVVAMRNLRKVVERYRTTDYPLGKVRKPSGLRSLKLRRTHVSQNRMLTAPCKDNNLRSLSTMKKISVGSTWEKLNFKQHNPSRLFAQGLQRARRNRYCLDLPSELIIGPLCERRGRGELSINCV